MRGFMYWSDWPAGLTGKETVFETSNQETGVIESAWLDGSNRAPFVSDDVVWANGLTIDSQKGRLFWCDSYLQTIESISLESGLDRQTHLSSDANPGVISRPYGLSFHNDLLLWCRFYESSILAEKFSDILSQNYGRNIVQKYKKQMPHIFVLTKFDDY
jgi:sugar lactone lactonase YvrE